MTKQEALRHAEILVQLKTTSDASLTEGGLEALDAAAQLLRDVANAEPVGWYTPTGPNLYTGYVTEGIIKFPVIVSPLEQDQ